MPIRKFVGTVASFAFIAAMAFVLGEVIVRVYTHYRMIYDLEMTRYSRLIKQSSADPRIGHVHRANSQARIMGAQIRINDDGFRDQDYSIERNTKLRMILLGDSLTFGWGVEKEQTFADILERKLVPPTEVINLGVGNYNTRQEVQLFIERGLKYHPDQVVVFYFLNDAEPVPLPGQWGFLQYSESLTLYWAAARRSLSHFTRSNYYQNYYKALYKDNQPGWIDAKNAMIELKTLCNRHRISLKVILLPELHQLGNYPFTDEHAKISRFLTQNGIQNLDLAPKFQHIEKPQALWVAPDDAHPNAIAHRMIADYSLDYLRLDK